MALGGGVVAPRHRLITSCEEQLANPPTIAICGIQMTGDLCRVDPAATITPRQEDLGDPMVQLNPLGETDGGVDLVADGSITEAPKAGGDADHARLGVLRERVQDLQPLRAYHLR